MQGKRVSKYKVEFDRTGKMKVPAALYASESLKIEDSAIRQLLDAAALTGVRKVIGTPDLHHGYGVPIGSVVALEGTICPAAVGYDINCGMRLLTTPLERGDVDVVEMTQSLRRDIPLGEGKSNVRMNKNDFRLVLEKGVSALREIKRKDHRVWEGFNLDETHADMQAIEEHGSMDGDTAAVSERAFERGISQLATLGGGNHFIEIQVVERVLDEKIGERFGLHPNQIVVMIHSGSRGLGHEIGGHYMRISKQKTRDSSPNPSLTYLPLDDREAQRYIKAMHAAANFAFVNRHLMAALVRKNFRHEFGDIAMPTVYDVPHNMAKLETHGGEDYWVHRKGATRAFDAARMKDTPYADVGQPVLIPGSMGTASYVLVGTPTADESLFSVNHGAGRTMSRTAATGRRPGWGKRRREKRQEAAISDSDFKRAMRGIHLVCADKRSIKEEAPQAYKDIDEVIETVVGADLAVAVARLKPLAVLKG
ncbi:MAG: RtcB family protein [Planctomycetota bacterium]|nr:MAG: RtcB family protein [Planctomycetota bacterium]